MIDTITKITKIIMFLGDQVEVGIMINTIKTNTESNIFRISSIMTKMMIAGAGLARAAEEV